MKKIICIILTLLVSIVSFSGCAAKVEYDSNTIKVMVFNGGYGTEWFEDLKNKFNEKSSEYKIMPIYKKVEPTDIITDVQTGRPNADVYFTCGVDFQRGILRNYFEDLSDVLEMKPDGASGLTVKEKMVDYDLWEKVASNRGNGLYVLPHTETLIGMVIDYDVFVENEWLNFATKEDELKLRDQGINFNLSSGVYTFVNSSNKVNYEEGDVILKAGKDGVFGTYDDGQPTTIEEFDEMLNKITNGNKRAFTFIYSGIAENYLNDVIGGVVAQYIGTDDYNILFNYDSNSKLIPMHDGSDKSISIDNGYEIFNSEAVYQGLNFVAKYLSSNKVSPKVLQETSFSHTDAQNDFLLAYKNTTQFPTILIEGTWWENEAKAMFSNIEKNEDPNRGFGKREYRYLLYPTIEGQATDADKSVLGGAEYSGVVVAKQKNANKLAVIKDFLAFTISNENLVNFTKYCGCKKYYNYSMKESDLDSLTPFARNCWEIMSDKKHVSVVPSRLYQASNPLTFTTNYISNCYVPIKSGAVYTMFPARFFRSVCSIQDLYDSKSNLLGYTASQWSEFINQARGQGFFQK